MRIVAHGWDESSDDARAAYHRMMVEMACDVRTLAQIAEAWAESLREAAKKPR